MLNNFRDRLLFIKLSRDERYVRLAFFILGIICTAIVINLIYLNVLFFDRNNYANMTNVKTIVVTPLPEKITPTGVSPTSEPNVGSNNNLVTTIATQQTGGVKDLYIPLGSGNTQAKDWTNIPGAEAEIDFGKYQNIKEIHFEASVLIPNTNETVAVRLYNVTDNHPVWYSQVTSTSSNNNYLISGPISYDFGLKLYQVQMQTQLQAPANLVQSRIHIILK